MATRARRRRKDQPWNPPSAGPDISTVFVLFAAGPLLLPVIGANADGIAFGAALVVVGYAGVRCFGARGRGDTRRSAWTAFTFAVLAAAVASLLGVLTIAGVPSSLALHTGALASLGLVAGGVLLARSSLRGVPAERALDALLMGLVIVGAGVYFVVVPGFADGDAILTAVVLVDIVAVLAIGLAMVGAAGTRRRMTGALLMGCATISAADALAALDAAGRLGASTWATAGMWALGSLAIAAAGALEDGRPGEPLLETVDSRWMYTRVLAPLVAVLAFPLMGMAVWIAGGLEDWAVVYFSLTSMLLLLLAFTRQARLLIDNRVAMTRERGLREEVMRRNEDLEAVTGLATTMTQTLEELPIVERGLEVLHLAARATSSSLLEGGRTRLVACAGDWHRERIWLEQVREPGPDERVVARRGGREIVQLPLAARGNDIGAVVMMRGDDQPFGSGEVELLRVLADQLAIAIQNARDYREKLEQAVRDPLTGLYNRRYLFEALEKEVHRARRYGSHASLVIFDVDDFKQINDTLGHTAGDEALRKIADVVRGLIRDVDSFARIGGEEFALLLPEAQQLDALLVAERVRTAIARTEILPDRRVTVSGGVSSCPQDGITRVALEQKADAALYWAKRNGKNICALSSEATDHAMELDTDGMLVHLSALVAAIDGGGIQTSDHSENVAAYAVAMAQELGMAPERIMRLRRAGLLHDVGKVAIPASILEKPAALDPHEYQQVQMHAAIGGTMLLHAGLELEASWVRAHHERVDGLGYPDGLAKGDIPIEARILFVADAFEAMTSDRSYRSGAAAAEAIAELRACAGTQFDPQVVEALAGLLEREQLDLPALRAREAPA